MQFLMEEVIIIGAGPAGCSAALALALRGRAVTLLDRGVGERNKLCAGGLPPKVLGVLPIKLDQLVERSVDRIRFSYDGDSPLELGFTRPMVHMVTRANLDRRLLDAAIRAGAKLLEGVTVTGLFDDGNQPRIETSRGRFRAGAVIAADGALGSGARLLGRAGTRLCPAVQADVRVPDAELARFERSLGCDFGVLPGGIGWVFPKAQFLSVGVCSFRPPADLARALARCLEVFGLHPEPGYLVRAHPLPVWDGRRTFRRGRILVAGDAAGLANPLTGAGIRRASISGQLAAETVHAYLAGGGKDARDLSSYDRRLNTHLVNELKRARFLARVFYRAPGIFHRLGVMNARVNPWVEELLSGKKTYLEVFRELSLFRWVWTRNAAKGSVGVRENSDIRFPLNTGPLTK